MSALCQLRLRLAVAADAEAMIRIHFAAFGPTVAIRMMNPGGPTADAMAKFRDTLLAPEAGRELLAYVAEVPEAQGPGYRIVAFGKYGLYRAARPAAEWAKPHTFTQEEVGDGASVAAFGDFLGGMHAMRMKAVQGRPHMALDILAVDPAAQRLGAGTALLRRGAEIADKEGLDLWLEASPQGYPLYRRHGYVAVDTLDLPATAKYGVTREPGEDWGANSAPEVVGPLAKGHCRYVLMKRAPGGAR